MFDSGKNQIDKRFLKKDEVVSSGESLTFDAYLVDIGDPTGANEDDADVKIQRRNHNATEKSDTLAGRQWKKLFSGICTSHLPKDSLNTQLFGIINLKENIAETKASGCSGIKFLLSMP